MAETLATQSPDLVLKQFLGKVGSGYMVDGYDQYRELIVAEGGVYEALASAIEGHKKTIHQVPISRGDDTAILHLEKRPDSFDAGVDRQLGIVMLNRSYRWSPIGLKREDSVTFRDEKHSGDLATRKKSAFGMEIFAPQHYGLWKADAEELNGFLAVTHEVLSHFVEVAEL